MTQDLRQNQPVQSIPPKPEPQTTKEVGTQPAVSPAPSSPPPWVTASDTQVASAAPETQDEGVKEPIFKKIIPILGVLLFIFLLYILITKVVLPVIKKPKENGDQSGDVTLTYWGLWEPENVVSSLITEYKKTHPNVTINYTNQSPKDYRERLQSALAREEGPDIFRYHNSWLPMLKKDLSPAPSEISQELDVETNYYPQVSKDLKSGGQLYGIPLGFDTVALYYNTRIFKTANKAAPTNWEDLRRAAVDLTVRDSSGRIKVAGVALGAANNVDHFSDILGMMMLQNGADLSQPTGSLAEDALRFYTIFYTIDKVWDKNLPNSTYAFANEQVAMIFAPSWRAHEIKNINPNIEFKTLPVPQLPDAEVAWATYWVEGVSAKSKNNQAAWEFLNYLSSKEALTEFYTNATKIRSFGEPYPRKDMAAELEDDEVTSTFVEQADYAQSWYMCSFTHDNGINDKIVKYFEDAVNSVLNGQGPRSALTTASQGVSQVLDQYGIK